MEEMPAAERRTQVASMPALLTHDEPRVRIIAAESLRRYAGIVEILEILKYLEEPRWGVVDEIQKLLQKIDADRVQAGDG